MDIPLNFIPQDNTAFLLLVEALKPTLRHPPGPGVISRVLTHAPLIVIVVSRTLGGAHPSLGAGSFSGAVCMNLLHAAHALGFAGPG
jgi:hypothetical protein